MRDPDVMDIPYFLNQGKVFAAQAGLGFDPIFYESQVIEWINNPSILISVIGVPARGHCGASLITSSFDGSEIIAKVFSIGGKGGLWCFRDVRRRAKELGATWLFADSYLEPRIKRIYERIGMKPTDQIYIEDLR